MDDIPDEFQCPITMDLMEDPVTCEDGNTYERKAILEYLKKNPISPKTRQPMNINIIIPNRQLKTLIADFKFKQEQKIKKVDKPSTSSSGISAKLPSSAASHTPQSDTKYEDKNDDVDEATMKLIRELTNGGDDVIVNSSTSAPKPKTHTPIAKATNVLMEIEDIIKVIDPRKTTGIINKYFGLSQDKITLFYTPLMEQDIDQLNWLVSNGNSIHKSFYTCAIFNKLPKVIRWLREKKCMIGKDAMNLAVEIGDKNLVFWLISNGCEWDVYTFSHAICSLNTNFLTWILEMGCFWGLVLDEHLHIINENKKIKEWLVSKKCPWNI
jgi:hypothetical protein